MRLCGNKDVPPERNTLKWGMGWHTTKQKDNKRLQAAAAVHTSILSPEKLLSADL